MQRNQNTVARSYSFEGKGLHTGKIATMTINPAPAGTGILFIRTDLGRDARVEAMAMNVSSTERSTTISSGEASVATIEHVMSALTGLGVDNALIEINNVEVPILDGSAKPYVDAIVSDGVKDLGVPRKYISIPETVEIKNEQTGAFLRIEPSDAPSYDLTVDFNSKVLGVQTAHWDESIDYAVEIGKCRTFVFFHEIEFLFKNNLIKGGDVDNAIVIVEHPVSDGQLQSMSQLLGKPRLAITSEGYLNNLELRFPNECGRHKLLDLIGDLRLAGGYLNARITAYKAGHTINTKAAKAVMELLKK